MAKSEGIDVSGMNDMNDVSDVNKSKDKDKDNKKSSKYKPKGYPLKFKNSEELDKYIKEYFEWAKENEMEITITGLCWWLKCSRTTLINYEKYDDIDWLKSVDDGTKRKLMNTIKEAKRYIEMHYEERLYNRSKATGGIFALKNNYNWVDKQEIVQTNKEIIVDIIDDDDEVKY